MQPNSVIEGFHVARWMCCGRLDVDQISVEQRPTIRRDFGTASICRRRTEACLFE
jgi:hypothetical protein